MVKLILCIIISLIMTLSLAACGKDGYNPEPFDETGSSECETSWEAVENIKVGWNLGNTLDSCGDWLFQSPPEAYETAWGNPLTTKDMIAAVKDAGFNAVRVPVTWNDHFDDNGVIDEAWFDRVQEVVDYVMSLDMYCILNMHHDAGSDGWLRASTANYAENGDTYAKIWEQIADRFKDYGEKLIFESINEILDENSNWNSPSQDAIEGLSLYVQRFVDTIRAGEGYNKTRNLVLMTYAGSAGVTLSNFVMPEDTVEDHLIIEIHNYDPVDFCWRDSWLTSTSFWGSDADIAEMDAYFADTYSRAQQFDAPLIIGEWGSEGKDDNDEDRARHASYFVKKAQECGFAVFWWDCGHFALIDRENSKVAHPEIVQAIMESAGVSAEQEE